MNSSPVVERECGYRVAGGAYIVVERSAHGRPVDDFLTCPPRAIDMQALGLSAIGTKLIEIDGVAHVFDVIGSDQYPNVADWVEEVRRLGVSRRIARTTDFSRLTPASRLIVIHARAIIENAATYHAARPVGEQWCPKDVPPHLDEAYHAMCGALWYEDVQEGAIDAHCTDAPDGVFVVGKSLRYDAPGFHMHRRRHEERAVVRQMKTFCYRAMGRPGGVQPVYQHGIFASFPIGHIQVVRDPLGGAHTEVIERARQSSAVVEEVDE